MSKKIAVIIVKPQLQHLYMGVALFLCGSVMDCSLGWDKFGLYSQCFSFAKF